MMLIAFEDTDAVLDVPDDEEFLGTLAAAAVDWPHRPVETGEPLVVVRRVGDAFEVRGPEAEPMLLSSVCAACSIIVDVLGAYIDAHPHQLCLHCGAVEVGGRLVVFPSRSRAGKSTLVARLAAGGHRVFGDDVLPITADDRSGIALGLAPRLRVPIPATSSPPFRDFVERRSSAGDDRYLYLDLPLGEGLAPRGTAVELGAVVLLDRQDSGRAQFYEAPRSAALKALISQNFSTSEPAVSLIDRLHAVMDRLPRYLLRYSDLDEAAELIGAAFSRWPADPAALPVPSDLDEALHVDGRDAGGSDADSESGPGRVRYHPAELAFRQNPSVALRSVDGELFLTDEADAAIHHLNMIGAGIWNLLAEPVCQGEAISVLSTAFPDVPREAIAEDVASIFTVLAEHRLILPVRGAAR